MKVLPKSPTIFYVVKFWKRMKGRERKEKKGGDEGLNGF